MGCVVTPGSRAAREIDKARREGRLVRVTPRKGESMVDALMRTVKVSDLPPGLRPGAKVGKRRR
jgi:hypothetical protein